MGTIPAGYADGVPLAASNSGQVLIRGRACDIIGRVSMDYLTVDLTSCPAARVGDPVILVGRSGSREITIEDWARIKQTHPYDIICSLGQNVLISNYFEYYRLVDYLSRITKGKQIGITLGAWLVVRAGLAALPDGVSWRHIYGGAWLGGIGFTMSLFVADLAFGESSLALAKIGILAASVIAGVGGYLVLWRVHATR